MPLHQYAPEPKDGFERQGPKRHTITLKVSPDTVRALRYVASISRLRPRQMLDYALLELADLAYSGHNFGQISQAIRSAKPKIKTPFRKFSGPEDLLVEDMIKYLKLARRHGIEPDLKRAFPGSGVISQALAYEQWSTKGQRVHRSKR